MNRTLTTILSAGALLAISTGNAMAAVYNVDSGGLTGIYSATIDGGSLGRNRAPCTGASPSYCAFLGLETQTPLAIAFAPNPSGISNAVPGGITPVPGAGSSLDITLSGGNTLADLNGGVITFGNVTLNILTFLGPPNATTVNASGEGFVLIPGSPGMSGQAVDANGIVQFLVGTTAGPTIGDFSSFLVVTSGCVGGLCALIPGLSLDMQKYVLTIDFDPTFTGFTASLIGQTGNNSLLYATLVAPIPGAVWLFGSALGMMGFARRRSA